MPFIYFLGAGVGVMVATIVAGIIRTSAARRGMREQLTLNDSQSGREETVESYKEPAAMISAG